MKKRTRVLVAMSGGVDSAVACFLLKEQGFDVKGANMRFWEYEEPSKNDKQRISSCCSPEDLNDAEKVARSLDIPFYVLKMEENFQETVIKPFIADYQNAKTPNPCVNCNTFIKFGDFFKKTMTLGFDYIATGHYANIKRCNNGRYAIFPAQDHHKDQSYYLYGLSQEALAKTIFPLAHYTKQKVKEIAQDNNLPVAHKPESQEICFIPDNNYRSFLKRKQVQFKSGYIRNSEGEILSKHQGKENYTIGQRKGLNISSKKALYVLDIQEEGDIIVGSKEELECKQFYCIDTVFQGLAAKEFDTNKIYVKAQIRYNSPALSAVIFKETNFSQEFYSQKIVIKVEMLESCYAVTPGQTVVFYDKEDGSILAGGKIKKEFA